MSTKIDEVRKILDNPLVEELEEQEETSEKGFQWDEIPWYYRLALFISNNLMKYTVLIFILGFFTGVLVYDYAG
jgi:hypothetical protein